MADDYVYVLATPECVDLLNKIFALPHAPTRLEERRFFGHFVLNGDAPLQDLAALYGLDVGDVSGAVTLGQYLARRFGGRQVIGDRIKLGGVELVVREIVVGAITRVGLKLHD